MGRQQLYWSHPRKFGWASRSSRMCSNRLDLIWKHHLKECHACFHQYTKDIGFLILDSLKDSNDSNAAFPKATSKLPGGPNIGNKLSQIQEGALADHNP
ncbi:40S ribosomal protein S29-like [Sturnira hondurensis]|uniref:40S ribosomal protein S29-like n=1 Tax=Sturnira hondurensis TaxID=192404 RepID=UPI0018796192|nr:40S ribosomal protein S29-like [Sturnira hondurensis]